MNVQRPRSHARRLQGHRDGTADRRGNVVMRAAVLRMGDVLLVASTRAALQANQLIARRRAVDEAYTPGEKCGQRTKVVCRRRIRPLFVRNRMRAPQVQMKPGTRVVTPNLANAIVQPAQINNLGQGLGKAVGSVAEIIITTPFKVLTIATGG